MVKPPEAKIYSLQLHRITLWTVGCGLLLVLGVTFLSGSLVGAWWALRTPSTALAQSPEGETLPGEPNALDASTAPSTDGGAASSPDAGSVMPGAVVRGPVATAPAATAPALRGPTVSSRGVTGPSVIGPRAQGPRVQGPRAALPTTSSDTVGGGRVGGGQVTPGSAAAAGSTAVPQSNGSLPGDAVPVGAPSAAGPSDGGPSVGAPLLGDSFEDPSASGSRYQFAVQIGLFTDQEALDAFLEELGKASEGTYVKTLRSGQRRIVVHSVRLGPWPERQTAEEAANNFRLDHRLGAAVVRELVEATP